MADNLVDGSLHLTADLTGFAVCIFIVDKDKCEEAVPQVPLKAMADRKLRQLVHALIEQRLDILLVIIIVFVIFHDPGKVIK